jgi:hypothetical protein
VTHSPYARAPDLSVTLSRIAAQYLTLIFHQHAEAKDVITSKKLFAVLGDYSSHYTGFYVTVGCSAVLRRYFL